MQKRVTGWKVKGMNRDLSPSAFTADLCFESRNLRLSANEGSTQMSWVNEKGPVEVELDTPISGYPIGYAVIGERLVVFTTRGKIIEESEENVEEGGDEEEGGDDVVVEGPDSIYMLWFKAGSGESRMNVWLLYNGDLNFSVDSPIETLSSYESEDVQKVYWTDGRNQPRVINLYKRIVEGDNTQFDFVSTLSLNETVRVEKQVDGSGVFAPGVIQYAFSYYRRQGQESNIFYTSPLLYVSPRDRGGNPEERVSNSFRITIENPETTRFDYLRIYSIQRTSINGTPIVKRVQDLSLDNVSEGKLQYTDTGTSGESVDPMELLYKGGETITAATMAQKDGTLFLGNIGISRPMIDKELQKRLVEDSGHSLLSITSGYRKIKPLSVSKGSYKYASQLTSEGMDDRSDGMTVPCGGFKAGEKYRLGVQFQYKTGQWSTPLYYNEDVEQTNRPHEGGDGEEEEEEGIISLPVFKGELSSSMCSYLIENGYKRVRGVMVFPEMRDRTVLCQAVGDKTLMNSMDGTEQSSWFFRPVRNLNVDEPEDGVTVAPPSNKLSYTENYNNYDPKWLRSVEIEGNFEDGENTLKCFEIGTLLTLHSPDIAFDEQMAYEDFHTNTRGYLIGKAKAKNTLSDINIQTETPTISSRGSGFLHKGFIGDGAKGIISGLFYDDYIVDDYNQRAADSTFKPFDTAQSSVKWLVYPWQGTGSLNNDINRPAGSGVQTALLKKKVISNLRYFDTTYFDSDEGPSDFIWNVDGEQQADGSPQLFSSDEVSVLKFDLLREEGLQEGLYKGNIDTMLNPQKSQGKYFAWDGLEYDNGFSFTEEETPFDSTLWCRTAMQNDDNSFAYGINKYRKSGNEISWEKYDRDNTGDYYDEVSAKKLPVRMRYKTTPHLVCCFATSDREDMEGNLLEGELPIYEVRRSEVTNRFGGTTPDAYRENVWLPCGEPVVLDATDGTNFYYDYGDTYYQRYDCLKTYPWSSEDINQVVEIGSFMLEGHVNIDGRYDRNRGQQDNLHASPQNFNLLNMVYSQRDNFFSYRIPNDDYYESVTYPNQITWTRSKQSGAETDPWTTITLASVLELDGSRGLLSRLLRYNDQLIAFQEKGVSQVLYNENTQISTSNGVPIEIANSGKVQGQRYLSDTIGCCNKWSISSSPMGIYFMDSQNRAFYLFNGAFHNLSVEKGMNSWCRQHIGYSRSWNPRDFGSFVSSYALSDQEVLFISRDTALAYSEKMGLFTSFYDYGDSPWLVSLGSSELWLRKDGSVWKHHGGAYSNFFGKTKPYSMTLVGNAEPMVDKIFTNLSMTAVVEGEGKDSEEEPAANAAGVVAIPSENDSEVTSSNGGRYEPYLPFDTLETWNEYQHGVAHLKNMRSHRSMMHHTTDNNSSLKRKFRIWHCDIPRDNAGHVEVFDSTFDSSFLLGERSSRRPMDRMRNPWLYLKLQKEVTEGEESLPKTELHDLVMTYYLMSLL